MPPQPIYCHHPHQHPHSHAAVAAAVQHQHAIYHQQQQQQQQQQQHYGTYTTAAHHQPHHMTALPQPTQQQIYQQLPAHLAALAPNGHPHSIYQPLVAVSQGIYVSNMATMRRPPPSNVHPQIPAHQQLPPSQVAHALQQMKSPQDDIANNVNSSAETSLYERDKQIYKCSTLRQGGKFDAKYKPSILNCPLPEIPKDADAPKVESIYQKNLQQNYSKTLQRPPMKILPQMKAIPPPRIGNNIALPPSISSAPTVGNYNITVPLTVSSSQPHSSASSVMTATTAAASIIATSNHNTTNHNDALPPPPPPSSQAGGNMEIKPNNNQILINNNNNNNNNTNNINSNHNQNNNNNLNNNNNTNNNMNNHNGMHNGVTNNNNNNMNDDDDDEDLPPPPPPAMTDESNYAVTEL